MDLELIEHLSEIFSSREKTSIFLTGAFSVIAVMSFFVGAPAAYKVVAKCFKNNKDIHYGGDNTEPTNQTEIKSDLNSSSIKCPLCSGSIVVTSEIMNENTLVATGSSRIVENIPWLNIKCSACGYTDTIPKSKITNKITS